MKYFCSIFICLLCTVSARGQASPAISYLPLSVLNETEELRSNAYVSAVFHKVDGLQLKDYSGQDAGTKKLADLIRVLAIGEKSGYLGMTVSTDATAPNSYEFYHMFVQHSEDPLLMAQASAGKLNFFYVLLDASMPLMAFCLEESSDGSLYNHPEILDQPEIVAFTDAVNKIYLFPERFDVVPDLPPGTSRIAPDSNLAALANQFALFMNVQNVRFDVKDRNDTANQYDPVYRPVLQHYRNMVDNLQRGDLNAYYNTLSAESKNRLSESFAMGEQNGFTYYRRQFGAYTLVTAIFDLGDVKILVAKNPEDARYNLPWYVYVLQSEGKIRTINIQSEFYMDDLLKSPALRKVIPN